MNKSKVKWLVLIIGMITIVTVFGFRIHQINTNHQANLSKLDVCVENGGKAVMEEGGLLSLSTVQCET